MEVFHLLYVHVLGSGEPHTNHTAVQNPPAILCHYVFSIINPRRACVRVTVLVLSVCLCVCVCFTYSGTSRNQAYKQQYQRLQHDMGMKYKNGIFL